MRSPLHLGVLALGGVVGCGAALPLAAEPRESTAPEHWEHVIAANADSPAAFVRDCDYRAQCIGVQGSGTVPEFDSAWLPVPEDLGDVTFMSGPWCHGYSEGVFLRSWEGVSRAVGLVADMLAAHDSSALVPVCIHYPSVYL